jgi:hypothetical protein
MKPKEHPDHAGLVSLRLLIALAICLGAPFLLRGATGPAWWYNGSLTTTGTPLVSGTANDFAAINQGQAKNVAVTAINELNTDLAQFGGAGDTLNQLALTLTATSAQTNDYAALSIGQLKFLAQPFYDRLISLSCTVPPIVSGTYPWVTSGLTANDFAIANIGQTKQLFSFDVTASSAGNGIPDWWVNEYFPGSTINGTVGIDPNGYVSWSGTTLTNLQAYQQGLNPIDFYNGQPPTLSVVSGDGQTGPPGGYLPLPLVVSVTGSNGAGIEGAPLTFQVTSGGGYIQPPGSATAGPSCTQFADSNGQAQVYFLLSGTPSTTGTITVTTGAGATAQQVQFSASSDDGTGTFASPFAPSNSIGTVNDDGSFTITWTNNTNGIESYIVIEQQQPDGTWLVISPQLPPGTTSYTIASPTGSGPYRVVSYTPSPSGTGNLSSTSNNTFPIIPTQSYAAIDISGTIGAPNVSQIALDDGGNAAFGFTGADGYTYSSYIFQSGTATLAQNIPFFQSSFPIGNGGVFATGFADTDEYYVYVDVNILTPTGAGISVGGAEYPFDPSTGDLPGDLPADGEWPVEFIGGHAIDLAAPAPPYGYLQQSGVTDAHDYGHCGSASGFDIDSNNSVSGSFITSPAGTVLFDPCLSG